MVLTDLQGKGTQVGRICLPAVQTKGGDSVKWHSVIVLVKS